MSDYAVPHQRAIKTGAIKTARSVASFTGKMLCGPQLPVNRIRLVTVVFLDPSIPCCAMSRGGCWHGRSC